MARYNQGFQAQTAVARREMWENGQIWCLVVLAIFVGIVLFSAAGCATTHVAVKGELVEIRSQETLRGLVRVAQMNADCDEQEAFMKRVLSDAFVAQGLSAPDAIEVKPLSGSSLCGMAQGVADPIGTPELGARDLAVAEATLYWSAIGYADLRKAQAVLSAMRPVSAAVSKTAQ